MYQELDVQVLRDFYLDNFFTNLEKINSVKQLENFETNYKTVSSKDYNKIMEDLQKYKKQLEEVQRNYTQSSKQLKQYKEVTVP